MIVTTLCYIENESSYLMLHRIKKKNDINQDKWIGVGGHMEAGESPEDCIRREALEETGLTLKNLRFRGLVTFICDGSEDMLLCLYTSGYEGEISVDCDEGELNWVEKEKLLELNLWEGDRIFFRLLMEEAPFFSLKLVYRDVEWELSGRRQTKTTLVEAALDGKPLELFDILNPDGTKTGIVRERTVAHRDGSLHATAHIWVVRPQKDSGRKVPFDLLLQKRSDHKDSHPGCYDVSSAGHVPYGSEVMDSAVREIWEELGLSVTKKQLHKLTVLDRFSDRIFYGQPFRNHERTDVYVLRVGEDFTEKELTLQESELSGAVFMDYQTLMEKLSDEGFKHCLARDELVMLGEYLAAGVQGQKRI